MVATDTVSVAWILLHCLQKSAAASAKKHGAPVLLPSTVKAAREAYASQYSFQD